MSNKGKKVKVHYVGTLDNGEVFDSSRERDKPIEFTCMKGQMIPGFDRAVENMQVGDVIDVHIEPQDAYGMPDPKNVLKVKFGEHLYFYDENDKPIMMTIKSAQHGKATFVGMKDKDLAPIVVNVGETHTIIARKMGKRSLPVVSAKNDIVEFDTNHRLAGKALNFNTELLEVEE